MIPGVRSKSGHGVYYTSIKNFDPAKVDIDNMLKWACWFYLKGSFYGGFVFIILSSFSREFQFPF